MTTMSAPSLFEWIMDLLRNDHAREAFQANPQAAMASAGLTASCGEDVKDAMPFIVDHPDVKWTEHRDFNHHPHHHHHDDDDDDAVEHVKSIVNNYIYAPHFENTYEFLGDAGDLGLQIAGDPGLQSSGDPSPGTVAISDSTLTDSLNTTSDDDGNASTGGTIVDQSGSTVAGDQVGRDNIDASSTIGDGSAGGNQVTGDGSVGGDQSIATTGDVGGDSTVTAAGGDQDHTESGLAALDHTVQTGDIHVLSDLVNTGDILQNGNVLNDLTALNDFDHLADVVGPLL
jgi:hypothetical protein